jgi:hypothetical protein
MRQGMWRRRGGAVVAVIGLLTTTGLAAPRDPEGMAAWARYVAGAERRINQELAARDRFLGIDFAGGAGSRARVMAGAVVVQPVVTVDAAGRALDVPDALVHHWRGAIFIPGISAAEIIRQLHDGAPPTRQEDVLASKVLDRGPDRMRVFLKLQTRKIVTVTYNTEHDVRFARHGAGRASSASIATKIAELRNANTPAEQELPPGADRGFLWKLNAYWRYQDVPGGIIAECESITLSRSVPSVLRYVVNPIIESTARESMGRTLTALRERFGE